MLFTKKVSMLSALICFFCLGASWGAKSNEVLLKEISTALDDNEASANKKPGLTVGQKLLIAGALVVACTFVYGYYENLDRVKQLYMDAEQRASNANQQKSEAEQRERGAKQQLIDANQKLFEANRQLIDANRKKLEAEQHERDAKRQLIDANQRIGEVTQERDAARRARGVAFGTPSFSQQLIDAEKRAREAQQQKLIAEDQACVAALQRDAAERRAQQLQRELEGARRYGGLFGGGLFGGPSEDEKKMHDSLITLGFDPAVTHPLRDINDRYRKLSLKNHPDKGGDTEVAARYNEAVDYLRKHVTS